VYEFVRGGAPQGQGLKRQYRLLTQDLFGVLLSSLVSTPYNLLKEPVIPLCSTLFTAPYWLSIKANQNQENCPHLLTLFVAFWRADEGHLQNQLAGLILSYTLLILGTCFLMGAQLKSSPRWSSWTVYGTASSASPAYFSAP